MEQTSKLSDLITPCFVVDKAKVKRNCEKMSSICKKLGVSLRPMMKTHKCIEAGVIATGGTRRRLSVSTVAEAEFYANAGFDDLLITLIFTEDKIPRMKQLHKKLTLLHVMLDSNYGIDVLEKHFTGRKWSVFLMIDAGDKRSGVLWDSPDLIPLVKRVNNSQCLDLAGIYVHDGESYEFQPDEVRSCGEQATDKLLQVAKKIRSSGVELKTIGIGSTPTSSQPAANMSDLTELHPGNYIFYDVQQMLLGSCQQDDIAGKVATRVTGHYPHRNQLLVDAGFLATSHDGKNKIPNGGSFCSVENEPNLVLVNVNQEVGFISAIEGTGALDFSKYPIGSLLYLLPWHSCATAAMHPKYYIHQGETVTETWINNHYW